MDREDGKSTDNIYASDVIGGKVKDSMQGKSSEFTGTEINNSLSFHASGVIVWRLESTEQLQCVLVLTAVCVSRSLKKCNSFYPRMKTWPMRETS